jgi:hypothetical protein
MAKVMVSFPGQFLKKVDRAAQLNWTARLSPPTGVSSS